MCSTRKRWAGPRLRKTPGLYEHKPRVANAVIMLGAVTAVNHAVVMFSMKYLGALLIFTLPDASFLEFGEGGFERFEDTAV